MSDVLIAAIAYTCDETEIEKVLSRCVGMETSRLTLYTRDILREAPARSRMHFVPFGGSARTTLALSAYLIDDDSNDLSGTGVTADAARYCKIAMDRGRSVVTYMACTENAALIEDQFRACGFLKIRRFSGN